MNPMLMFSKYWFLYSSKEAKSSRTFLLENKFFICYGSDTQAVRLRALLI